MLSLSWLVNTIVTSASTVALIVVAVVFCRRWLLSPLIGVYVLRSLCLSAWLLLPTVTIDALAAEHFLDSMQSAMVVGYAIYFVILKLRERNNARDGGVAHAAQ